MNQPIIYIFGIAVLFLSACSFIANANEDKDGKQSTKMPIYDVDIESDVEDYQDYHISIQYPDTPNNQIDQKITDYVNQRKAMFKQKSYLSTQEQEMDQPTELQINFEVIHQDHRYFNVRFLETMRIGSEEPIEMQTVLNFDKKTGSAIDMEKIFKADKDYLGMAEELAREELDDESVQIDPRNLALSDKGILLFLDQSKADWPDHLLLKRKEVKEWLKEEYLENLGQNQTAEGKQ